MLCCSDAPLYKLQKAEVVSETANYHLIEIKPAARTRRFKRLATSALLTLILLLPIALPKSACAEIVLSEVIVDLSASAPQREDIEVWNSGTERVYVVAEPATIKAPGTIEESRVQMRDPGELGLLVSPNRLVLEPGQRKLVRVAALKPATDRDEIYRVTFKPVVGTIEASTSGLKVLVGYDVLVIVRPPQPTASIIAKRSNDSITFENHGNTNAEMFGGRQCDSTGRSCIELPSHRLYAGAIWQVPLTRDTPVEYLVKVGQNTSIGHY